MVVLEMINIFWITIKSFLNMILSVIPSIYETYRLLSQLSPMRLVLAAAGFSSISITIIGFIFKGIKFINKHFVKND